MAQRKVLQRVINTAKKIVGCLLPTLEELHSSCCLKKAQNIIKGHPASRSIPVWTVAFKQMVQINYHRGQIDSNTVCIQLQQPSSMLQENNVQWFWMWIAMTGSMHVCRSMFILFLCNDWVCVYVCTCSFLNTEWCTDWRTLLNSVVPVTMTIKAYSILFYPITTREIRETVSWNKYKF